jgi:hypothetical protein
MEIPRLNLANGRRVVDSLRQGLIDAAVFGFHDERNSSCTGALKHIAEWIYVKAARRTRILPLARARNLHKSLS